ncbi:alcohol dehydrogenase-like 3 [Macadamia integrifolia]|uniref:alcohol dehydrogenase-like 3 n=1 Tax=Macadamia integrifolia TaxID=60698 RepID=UPI001C4F2CA0|nr:alcohol dehydrogenase-like 3 [Macadamia integrifolia]
MYMGRIVESVGEGVSDMREGDKVVPIFNGECGDCAYCKCEKTNLCRKFRVNPMKSVMVNDGKTRFWTRDGQKPIYHFLNTSTFVEYTVLDSACVVKIDAQAPLRKMSLLSCGVSTGIGAAWNTANVQEGSSVAIFGLGAVGLAVAEGARLRGASQIIGIDINPDKFIKGKTVGITHFINPNDIQKEKDHKAVHEASKAPHIFHNSYFLHFSNGHLFFWESLWISGSWALWMCLMCDGMMYGLMGDDAHGWGSGSIKYETLNLLPAYLSGAQSRPSTHQRHLAGDSGLNQEYNRRAYFLTCVIQEMTKGGVDYSFECSGNLEVLQEAFSSTHDVRLFVSFFLISF